MNPIITMILQDRLPAWHVFSESGMLCIMSQDTLIYVGGNWAMLPYIRAYDTKGECVSVPPDVEVILREVLGERCFEDAPHRVP